MPRMANSGDAVNAWYEVHQQGSSTFDLCIRCADKYEGKPLPKQLETYQTGEPAGELEEMDPCPEIEYWDRQCEVCNVRLRDANYYRD